uniref:Uncharacterized protein n=1 Tax=Arundo donax TaxID=35708 RepID=A0A0A8ZYD1_ARUDO
MQAQVMPKFGSPSSNNSGVVHFHTDARAKRGRRNQLPMRLAHVGRPIFGIVRCIRIQTTPNTDDLAPKDTL